MNNNSLCYHKFNKKDIIKMGGRTMIGNIKINNKNYILKTEWKTSEEQTLTEYLFLVNNEKKIITDNMNKNILVPLNIIDCSKNKKLYIFEKLDYIYNYSFIKNLLFNDWLDYTIQLCLTIYYINHILNIHHNDLFYSGKMNNIMVKKNNKSFRIKVDNFDYEIKNNYIVIIDFGHADSKNKFRTFEFYNSKYKQEKKYIFESEVFAVFYYSYNIFFNNNTDKYSEKFDDIYNKMISEIKNNSTLKEFNNHVIESLLKLKL